MFGEIVNKWQIICPLAAMAIVGVVFYAYLDIQCSNQHRTPQKRSGFLYVVIVLAGELPEWLCSFFLFHRLSVSAMRWNISTVHSSSA